MWKLAISMSGICRTRTMTLNGRNTSLPSRQRRLVLVSPRFNINEVNAVGCHITWFCSARSWLYVRTIMGAAILCNDDVLNEWMSEIIRLRYTTTLWCDPSYRYPFNLFGGYDAWEMIEQCVRDVREHLGGDTGNTAED